MIIDPHAAAGWGGEVSKPRYCQAENERKRKGSGRVGAMRK